MDHLVGVFYRHLERVYRVAGQAPTVVAEKETPDGVVALGLWDHRSAEFDRMLRKSRMTEEEMNRYFFTSPLGERLMRLEPA